MVAALREESRGEPFAYDAAVADSALEEAPVVVVGTGPAGARTVQELTRRMPHRPIVWCGAERCEPYNRVHLSSLLSGDLGFDRFGSDYSIAPNAWLDRRLGCEIVAIDRDKKQIIDSYGNAQRYSYLVLAIGSHPRIPNIPNISLPGVYTFRNFADAEALYARLMRSRRTVVIGGGLLGLEAAKAMHRFNTEVVVLESAPRLMTRQLDDAGAAVLKQHIEAMGIEVRLKVGIKRIVGAEFVTGVELQNDEVIECDTIVVATGISPNVDLARRAGLAVGNGIHIDDETRTDDPFIHAVGECAEHRGVVYGLAAPGIEQATVAAGVIAGETTTYDGTISATRLKVVGMPVFSIGEVLDENLAMGTHAWSYRSPDSKTYARIVTRNGRLIGAAAVGDIADVGRLQDAVTQKRLVWSWQLWSFMRSGKVWSNTAQVAEVAQWPEATTVCNCMGVSRGQLTAVMASGCATVEALAARTGASTVCGSCKPLLAQLASSSTPMAPAPASKPLNWLAAMAGILSVLWLLPWSVPYSDTASASNYDFLWRDIFWKQVSGYSLLGASALTLVLSLRKRVAQFRTGEFAWWRVAHAVLGISALVGFFVHTGGRLGSNLNLVLSLSFIALTAVGAYASLVIAKEHKLGASGIAIRRKMVWLHVMAFWPLPTLLAFHVAKTYFF